MAITIPTIDETHEQASGYSPTGPSLSETNNYVERGADALANGIDRLGAGIDEGERRDRIASARQAELARRAKEKADEIAAANALTQLQTEGIKTFHGDSQDQQVTGLVDLTQPQTPDNPNPGGFVQRAPLKGFLATQGEEAVALSQPTWAGFEKTAKKIEDGLANPEQKQAFQRHAAGMMNDYLRQLETHVSQQTDVANKASVDALEESALVAARNNYRSVDTARDVSGPVEALRQSRALSPQDGVAKKAEWRSKVDLARLKGAMDDQNWEFASALFGETKDQLGPAVDREQLHKTIEAGVIGQQASVGARELYASTVSKAEPWGNAAVARQELGKLPPGPLSDAKATRLEREINYAEEKKKNYVTGVFNSALAAYQQGGSLTAVNPQDKIALQDKRNDPTAWERLKSIARADAEHHRGAPTSPAEQRAFGQFAIWAASNPDKAAQMSEDEFNAQVVGGGEYSGAPSGPLAKKDRERAAALLASYHGKMTKPEALSAEERNLLIQSGQNSAVFGQGKDVTKWTDAEVSTFTAGEAKLSAYKAMVRKQTGKDPTPKEMEAKVGDLVLEGKIPGSGWFGTSLFEKKTTALEAEQKGTAFRPAWKDDEKAKARAGLLSAGRAPTEEAIDAVLRRVHNLPTLPAKAVTLTGNQTAAPQSAPTPSPGD